MEKSKTKIILLHTVAWLSLIAYHTLTGILLQNALYDDLVRLFSYHLCVYIPVFYLIYFLVLGFYERHKNIPLLLATIIAGFALYVLLMFGFIKYLYPKLNPDYDSSKVRLNESFILEVIDYFFLYYFLYALLYWYARRTLKTQKALREKELQEYKTRQQLHELEGMALRAQMNPHFIFNSLNSVQLFIVDKDMETANRYLGRFGHLIRQTLDNSSQPVISLEKEAAYLTTYLELEQLRHPGTFTFVLDMTEAREAHRLCIPTMMLQPFVENAVKHGMRNKTGNTGRINISIAKEGRYLLCSITDNGPGRNKTEIPEPATTPAYESKGMQITEKRIQLLNENQRAGIIYRVNDVLNEAGNVAGTRVEILFPLIFVQKPDTL